jgi:putative transposase
VPPAVQRLRTDLQTLAHLADRLFLMIIAFASRSFRMICPGVCFLPLIENLLAPRVTCSPFLGPCGMQEFSISCILKEGLEAMKRKRYTEEQIAFALRQHDSGTAVEEIIRKMGISEPTFYRWKKKFAGLGVAELRRLKQLEEENKKLKQLVADLSLDKKMLQDVVSGKY